MPPANPAFDGGERKLGKVPLRAAHDEEAQFELVVAAAVGAASERLAAALAALEGA